jgi:hypothetical protein
MMKTKKARTMKNARRQALCFTLFFALLSQPFFSIGVQPQVAEAQQECPTVVVIDDKGGKKCLRVSSPSSKDAIIPWTLDCTETSTVSCGNTLEWFKVQKIGDQVKFGSTLKIDEEIKFFSDKIDLYKFSDRFKNVELNNLKFDLEKMQKFNFESLNLPKFNNFQDGVVKNFNLGKVSNKLNNLINANSGIRISNALASADVSFTSSGTVATTVGQNLGDGTENVMGNPGSGKLSNKQDKALNCYLNARAESDRTGTYSLEETIENYQRVFNNTSCKDVPQQDLVAIFTKCRQPTTDTWRNLCQDPNYVKIELHYGVTDSCKRDENKILYENNCYKDTKKITCPPKMIPYANKTTTVGTKSFEHASSDDSTNIDKTEVECLTQNDLTNTLCQDNQSITNNALSTIKRTGSIAELKNEPCAEKKSILTNVGNFGWTAVGGGVSAALAFYVANLLNPQKGKAEELAQQAAIAKSQVEIKQAQTQLLNEEKNALTTQKEINALKNPPAQPTPPSDNSSPPPTSDEEESDTPFIPPVPSNKPVPATPAKPPATTPSKNPTTPTTPATDEDAEETAEVPAQEDKSSLPSPAPSVDSSGDGSVEDTIMVLLELIDQRKVTGLRNSIAGVTRARSVVKGQEINGINVGKLAESYGGDGGVVPVLGKEYDVNGDGTVNKEDYSALEKITRICNKNVTKSPCQVFFKL